jgi:hypothetical protein
MVVVGEGGCEIGMVVMVLWGDSVVIAFVVLEDG